MEIISKLFGICGYRCGVVRRAPWLMLRPSFDNEDLMTHRFYKPEKGKEIERLTAVGPDATSYGCYRPPNYVGSSHGWLASYDPEARNMFFSNPVSGQFRFLPITRYPPSLGDVVHRVVFSSSPNDRDCRALMIFGKGQRLAVGFPGRSYKWSRFVYGRDFGQRTFRHENVAYSNKRGTFFCITRDEQGSQQGSHGLCSFDLRALSSLDCHWTHPPKTEWIVDPLPILNDPNYEEDECLNIKYLVFHEDSDSDQLYLVVRRALPLLISNPTTPFERSFNIKNSHYCGYRDSGAGYPHKTVDFAVYKIDIEGKKASYCHSSLDGLALFVGTNECVAVRVTPEMTTSLLQPDSIYFTDLPQFTVGFYSSHDIGDNGVFNYQTKSFYNFLHDLHDYPIDIRSCILRQMLSAPLPLWYAPQD